MPSELVGDRRSRLANLMADSRHRHFQQTFYSIVRVDYLYYYSAHSLTFSGLLPFGADPC